MIVSVSDDLSDSMVNNLLKQLPEAEVVATCKDLKPQYADLVKAEQFLVDVSFTPNERHIYYI